MQVVLLIAELCSRVCSEHPRPRAAPSAVNDLVLVVVHTPAHQASPKQPDSNGSGRPGAVLLEAPRIHSAERPRLAGQTACRTGERPQPGSGRLPNLSPPSDERDGRVLLRPDDERHAVALARLSDNSLNRTVR